MKQTQRKSQTNHQLYEVWGDVIAVKPLLFSLALAVVMGLGFFLVAPEDDSIQLMVGIGGIVIATVINSFLFKPKRNIDLVDDRQEGDQ